jgi:hypothetical protein
MGAVGGAAAVPAVCCRDWGSLEACTEPHTNIWTLVSEQLGGVRSWSSPITAEQKTHLCPFAETSPPGERLVLLGADVTKCTCGGL